MWRRILVGNIFENSMRANAALSAVRIEPSDVRSITIAVVLRLREVVPLVLINN